MSTLESPIRWAERGALCPTSIPFDAITDPGSYVCNWSGHLLRIPPDMLGPRCRKLNIVGQTPLFVTKISDDALVPVSQARRLAADMQLEVRF